MSRRSNLVTIFRSLCLAVALFLVTGASLTQAQQDGVRIQPAETRPSKTIEPGSIMEVEMTIRNLDARDKEYYLFTRNIKSTRDAGIPVFAEPGERTGYELADWITLDTNRLQVAGNESETITFQIQVPDNASPGSHFGGVFVSVEPPNLERSGAAVGYQVAHLISLRIAGDVREEASIRQFSTSKYFYGSQNVDFNVRIENNGNTLVTPRGPLEIYNMLGVKVDTITFNETEAAVFPGETREYNKINWVGDSVGFGRYEAILSPSYGADGAIKTMSSTVSFWILPMSIIGPALGALAVILLVIFIFVRIYINRSLAHLSGGRRMVRKKKKSSSTAILLLMVTMLSVTAVFMIILLALFA